MGDEPSVCNGRNHKNVSFAQETTIVQEVSVESTSKNQTDEFEATQPYQPGSMDFKKALVFFTSLIFTALLCVSSL